MPSGCCEALAFPGRGRCAAWLGCSHLHKLSQLFGPSPKAEGPEVLGCSPSSSEVVLEAAFGNSEQPLP